MHSPRRVLWIIYSELARSGVTNFVPDKLHLQICYRLVFGRKLNLDFPKSYNEKIQWLKLYDRNPDYSLLVDKYEAKKLIAQKIGEKYIIPTLGVWDSFDEINFDTLPEQFVLKCTHDSGGVVICTDKSKLNRDEAKHKLEKSLRRNFYWWGREWVYKSIKPRIIAEKYMIDDSGFELKDYKFICFNGIPQVLLQTSGRYHGDKYMNYFDMNKNLLPVSVTAVSSKNATTPPKTFEEMKKLAGILSSGITNVRVDFYEISGQPYFGELTFYDGSGFDSFTPDDFDFVLGEKMILPSRKQPETKHKTV